MIGDNHDYLRALHTDTPRAHVHLTVQAEGLNRKLFDPRREDLFRFREAFVGALRSRGVEAEATPRYSRGQGRAGTRMALTRSEEHTSELQSLMRISYAVLCLKKTTNCT